MSAMRSRARELAIDAAICGALIVAKALLGAWVLHLGFTHVSDDDYARVVIAQLFAHAPKIDPSGTSWLPFPFWLNGVVMMVFGRSLETARVTAFALGALSVLPPYLAARAVGARRWVAAAGVAIAMVTPWSAWLGVATVPEAMTGALVAAGAIAMHAANERARVWAAVGLMVAALSRYEAWPVCAAFAIANGVVAVRIAGAGRMAHGASAGRVAQGAWRAALASTIAIAGPLSWMAWNAYAHGSVTHFLARVSAYRQAVGAAAVPVGEKLLDYPRALLDAAWPLLALGAVGAIGLVDREVRARWTPSLAAMIAMFVMLVYGDARDGAPTHHAARALTPIFWVLAIFGIDGTRAAAARIAWSRPKREMFVVGAAAACAVAWLAMTADGLREFPARSAEENRAPQIARGRELHARGVMHVEITPCAYEHFALMAAMGTPELIDVRQAAAGGAKPVVTDACPAARPR